jgi:hypothetical protein
MVRADNKEEARKKDKALSHHLSANDQTLLPRLEMKEKVDSLIEQGFTDLWLLITGEELDGNSPRLKKSGSPLALVYGGQLRLLGSKVAALDTLRSVGVELY